ncbi:MAG: hypothetical protein ACE5WD_04525 [Candidatus Aminicenantia bacterium]
MLQFRKIDNKKEWQELLNKALFKTFFHNLRWEEFLEKTFKWLKFEHFLYKDEILLSFAKYKVFGKEKLISHPFCEYGGPLPLKEDIDGREFRENLFSEFQNQFKISFHPHIPKYFKGLALKEPDSSRDTYFIENLDQKSEEEIYSSFRKTLRHSIKKAKKGNLEIKKCESGKEVKDFYNLYVRIIKRHKTLAYPFSLFQHFFNSPHCEIILAKFENKIIAGSVFLFYPVRDSEDNQRPQREQISNGVYNKFIHYFLNASDLKYRGENANHLILWTQIQKYIGKDYHTFDLGGTRRGSALEIFKKGWGAKRYPIFELRNYPEEKFKKSKLRNIFRILPSFLIREISSYLLKYKL